MWHGIFLGNGADAFTRTTQIQSSFMLAFMASGGNIEMAMFSKSESMEDAHEVTIYFSPAASAFAKTILGVSPCEKPSREKLGLLVGDMRCWNVLFPPTPKLMDKSY